MSEHYTKIQREEYGAVLSTNRLSLEQVKSIASKMAIQMTLWTGREYKAQGRINGGSVDIGLRRRNLIFPSPTQSDIDITYRSDSTQGRTTFIINSNRRTKDSLDELTQMLADLVDTTDKLDRAYKCTSELTY